MDYRKSIGKGTSKSDIEHLANELSKGKHSLSDIFDVILEDLDHTSMRLAWSIRHLSFKSPSLLTPFTSECIQGIKNSKIGGVRRELIKTLETIKYDKSFEGEILDLAFDRLNDPSSEVAEKYYSMKLLDKLSRIYPEIQNELKESLSAQLDLVTPSFKRQALKVIRRL